MKAAILILLTLILRTAKNPIDGKIIMSNLCTEIFQVQRDSVINNDQTYEFLGNDVSCNLGSTNVTNLMASPDFGKSVRTIFACLNVCYK